VTYQNNRPSLRLSMLIIATGAVSTSLAQPDLLDLPIRHLLKDELHASQSQMAMLFGMKPFAGLLVDNVALFGTHRRHYLIISTLLTAVLWLILGLVSRSYFSLLVTVVVMQSMLVIGSTVLGGLLVEWSRLLGAEGRLVSCRIFVEEACTLIAGPLAGYLAGLSFGTAVLIAAAIAVMTAPIAAMYVAEPVQDKTKALEARHPLRDLRLVLNSRVMWLVAVFSLVFNIPQSFETPLYFYQKNALALSDVQIGYLTAVGGIGGLSASLFYQFLCRKLSMQGLLVLGTLGSFIGIAAYLFYTSLPAALIVEFLSGFLFGIGTLAVMQGAVIATLAPAAAFGFAVLTSAANAGARRYCGGLVGGPSIDDDV
jgi:Na+/melibiose symporter-like transporter